MTGDETRLARRSLFSFVKAVNALRGAFLLLLLWAGVATAAPALRYQVDLRGDLLIFGNTVGFACRPGAPMPVVGTIGACNDTGKIDVLWRSDDPMNGQA